MDNCDLLLFNEQWNIFFVCVFLYSEYVCACVCLGRVYLVNYILPVLDEGDSAFAAVCVFSEVKCSRGSPQIQLSQRFPDGYFRLGTTVQVLQTQNSNKHIKHLYATNYML